jgi:hypothetical protein
MTRNRFKRESSVYNRFKAPVMISCLDRGLVTKCAAQWLPCAYRLGLLALLGCTKNRLFEYHHLRFDRRLLDARGPSQAE